MAMKQTVMRVSDVYDRDRSLATVVEPNDPFENVVRTFAQKNELRGVFVVERGRLIGVITRQDLLNWAAGRLHDGTIAYDSWHDLYRIMSAATAKDACRPRSEGAAVNPDEPLSTALRHMIDNDLIDIPVVDGEGNLVGDIRLPEILAAVLEHGQD